MHHPLRHFDQLIGDYVSKQWPSEESSTKPLLYVTFVPQPLAHSPSMTFPLCRPPKDTGPDKEYAHIDLHDLVRVETLGMGGFGRVELVSW